MGLEGIYDGPAGAGASPKFPVDSFLREPKRGMMIKNICRSFCRSWGTFPGAPTVMIPMAIVTPNILLGSVIAGIVLAAAPCTVLVAPGGEKTERPGARDPVRTYRPRTPAEFFKQDVVRFQHVRIDSNGLIYADGHSLNLYGAALIRRNRICTSPEGARWACGQRAFVALRNLMQGKSIACMFNHVVEPPKAACSVGDKDVAQFLLSEGWAELAEGVTEDMYIEAHTSAQSRKAGIWADGPP